MKFFNLYLCEQNPHERKNKITACELCIEINNNFGPVPCYTLGLVRLKIAQYLKKRKRTQAKTRKREAYFMCTYGRTL